MVSGWMVPRTYLNWLTPDFTANSIKRAGDGDLKEAFFFVLDNVVPPIRRALV